MVTIPNLNNIDLLFISELETYYILWISQRKELYQPIKGVPVIFEFIV